MLLEGELSSYPDDRHSEHSRFAACYNFLCPNIPKQSNTHPTSVPPKNIQQNEIVNREVINGPLQSA